jgi:protoporphyrinogen oxidase
VETFDVAIVGGGITGLAAAAFLEGSGLRVCVVERDVTVGGHCRSVVVDGFTFDHSGHFFHFRDADIAKFMRAHAGPVSTLQKRARVRPVLGDTVIEVDAPLQASLHQLDAISRAACLASLPDAPAVRATTFDDFITQRYGTFLSSCFFTPYNEKLYATQLRNLDVLAMGRFFPDISVDDMRRACVGESIAISTYNDTFEHPVGGSQKYVDSVFHRLFSSTILAAESVQHVDVDSKTLTTTRRNLRARHIVNTLPLPRWLALCGETVPELSWSRVLVFNLGFDRKGRSDVHWIYVADPRVSFYRVGFYDNIHGGDRMSLYVEVGLPAHGSIDVEAWRARVMADLRAQGLVTGQRCVVSHVVVMDPAYVHVSVDGMTGVDAIKARFRAKNIYSIGRYGGWTYCSIEDNILEARATAVAITAT